MGRFWIWSFEGKVDRVPDALMWVRERGEESKAIPGFWPEELRGWISVD